ncbi:MAG: DUF5119 domain-containing protein [Muribaculaceae bacterium]|nr:DUF5119 domain-containing protein [Muribaculaceae bacterium]
MMGTKTKHIIAGILLPTIGGMLLSSCRHKDLYMEEDMTSELQVVFDWSNAPDAQPESMAFFAYEQDGYSPVRFIFPDRNGGMIRLPFGTRHAICMNADCTDWAQIRGNEYIETMEIYTHDARILGGGEVRASGIPRPEGTEEERIVKTPGMMWGSRSNGISIAPHTGMQTITMYPEELVCHYVVDVYDVDNIGSIESSAVDATLSGMAEGYNHGAHTGTDNSATMQATLTTNPAGKSMHGEFLTFGECPSNSQKHYLTLYMVLQDGSKWYHSFDVSEQVSDAPDKTHVHIIVRGVNLPEPPKEGGTLTPDVNEWQPVDITLQM